MFFFSHIPHSKLDDMGKVRQHQAVALVEGGSINAQLLGKANQFKFTVTVDNPYDQKTEEVQTHHHHN
jgi:hypothetical protein